MFFICCKLPRWSPNFTQQHTDRIRKSHKKASTKSVGRVVHTLLNQNISQHVWFPTDGITSNLRRPCTHFSEPKISARLKSEVLFLALRKSRTHPFLPRTSKLAKTAVDFMYICLQKFSTPTKRSWRQKVFKTYLLFSSYHPKFSRKSIFKSEVRLKFEGVLNSR
jgi:hypothetical protein